MELNWIGTKLNWNEIGFEKNRLFLLLARAAQVQLGTQTSKTNKEINWIKSLINGVFAS